MSASDKGHMKVVKLLLDGGASVNAEVDIMGTALMMAAYCLGITVEKKYLLCQNVTGGTILARRLAVDIL